MRSSAASTCTCHSVRADPLGSCACASTPGSPRRVPPFTSSSIRSTPAPRDATRGRPSPIAPAAHGSRCRHKAPRRAGGRPRCGAGSRRGARCASSTTLVTATWVRRSVAGGTHSRASQPAAPSATSSASTSSPRHQRGTLIAPVRVGKDNTTATASASWEPRHRRHPQHQREHHQQQREQGQRVVAEEEPAPLRQAAEIDRVEDGDQRHQPERAGEHRLPAVPRGAGEEKGSAKNRLSWRVNRVR